MAKSHRNGNRSWFKCNNFSCTFKIKVSEFLWLMIFLNFYFCFLVLLLVSLPKYAVTTITQITHSEELAQSILLNWNQVSSWCLYINSHFFPNMFRQTQHHTLSFLFISDEWANSKVPRWMFLLGIACFLLWFIWDIF